MGGAAVTCRKGYKSAAVCGILMQKGRPVRQGMIKHGLRKERQKMTNILVCDDDREIVEAIEIYLAQEGYHVIKAYDGEQAIRA